MTMMMESRGSGGGGCCVARYDAQKVDRIMLRFRPIAPKPTTGGSSSGGSSPESNSNGDTYAKIGRGKRRYKSNTINNNNNSNGQKNSCKRRKESPEVVTLSLLPEAPEKSSKRSAPNAPIWLNFNSGTAEKDDDVIGANSHRPIYYTPDRTVIVLPRVVGDTCVTLECLTYTMVDADALGRTDKERVMNLVRDTCPGFVSDRLSRVTWSNEAFKEMVGHDQADYRAWVAMKESVPAGARAFSCRVKVLVENNKQRKTMTVPCDVWRMDYGGFAWRLDVKAALTLGL
uniref:DUF7950 domain-containing protein n=1 Tax=Kalanchoe fedtschenkoi TaxID=63787 RepID=A0A7N0UVT7_KALFE